jgi:pimeloyl-ACP methyl ester carboxylesterase
VIFLSSLFGLCRWPVNAEKRAQRDGLRIIAPIRAGFGGSTPYANKARRTDRFAEDVLALMDHLGVATAPLMVMDSDMPYAARLFNVAPDRFDSVLGCSSLLPLTTPQQYERMGRWHRFILGTARYAPQFLTFVVRVAFAMARQRGKDEFVRLVYNGSPVDVAMTRDAQAFAPVDCGSDVVLGQGFDAAAAYVQELIVVHRTNWRGDLDAMLARIPVTVIIGAQDQGITAETFDEHRLEYPSIRFIHVRDAGSFLFFQKWDAVLDELNRQIQSRI